MRFRLRYILFLSFLVLFSNLAYSYSAMGVTPASSVVVYTGQKEIVGEIKLMADGTKNIRFKANREMGQYIFFEDNQSILEKNVVGAATIKYYIRLPEDIKPGEYLSSIVAIQYFTPEEEAEARGFATGFAAIGHVIKIRVPNDGKYLEAKMSKEPPKLKIGQLVYFTIDLLNFGTDDLTNIKTDIVIKDPDGTELDRRPTNEVLSMSSGAKSKLKAYWNSEGYSAGMYSAEANINYGGKFPAEPKLSFRLGDISIKIINVTTELEGAIGKVFINLESNWNNIITKVYADIVIKNGSETLDTIRTSSIDMNPWGKDTLVGFWERNSLPSGDYDMEIFVYYYDKQAKKQMKVELPDLEKPAPQEEDKSPMLLIVAISILALILIVNMAWFFVSAKGKKEKKKGKKR